MTSSNKTLLSHLVSIFTCKTHDSIIDEADRSVVVVVEVSAIEAATLAAAVVAIVALPSTTTCLE